MRLHVMISACSWVSNIINHTNGHCNRGDRLKIHVLLKINIFFSPLPSYPISLNGVRVSLLPCFEQISRMIGEIDCHNIWTNSFINPKHSSIQQYLPRWYIKTGLIVTMTTFSSLIAPGVIITAAPIAHNDHKVGWGRGGGRIKPFIMMYQKM